MKRTKESRKRTSVKKIEEENINMEEILRSFNGEVETSRLALRRPEEDGGGKRRKDL